MTEINFKPSVRQDEAWQALEDSTTNIVLYGGAAGGGKSYLGAAWQIYRRLRYPGSRGLIGRAVLKDLKESTLVTLNKIATDWGITHLYRYNEQRGTIDWYNGSRTVLKDLAYEPSDPDYQRLGSSEYTDVMIEEGAEVPEKAEQIVYSRIRWRLAEYGLVPKLYMTCNPGYHWIRDKYIRDAEGNEIVLPDNVRFIQALVTDNPDKAFVELYMASLMRLNDYDRERLLYGNWDAVEKTGAEFYKEFDSQRHTGAVYKTYDPEAALHIAFDFNVVPYITATIWQMDGKAARQLNEITPGPKEKKNNTIALCREIMKEYGEHRGGCFVYGDPAGKSRDTRSEEGLNDYTLVFRELKPLMPKDRVQSKAPGVSMRGNFINEIFKSNLAGISILIDAARCRNTLADYMYLKEASDGTKLKQKVRDNKTGQSYEKYGHTSDANDYFLCKAFEADWLHFISKGTGKVKTGRRTVSRHVF